MELKPLLEKSLTFRERSQKDVCLAKLLIQKYNLDIEPERLKHVLQEYNTLDRNWRKILNENEHLRGTDYGEKQGLEERKLTELGYINK